MQEAWGRKGEGTKKWLIEKIKNVDVNATITERTTLPSNCCKVDGLARSGENWRNGVALLERGSRLENMNTQLLGRLRLLGFWRLGLNSRLRQCPRSPNAREHVRGWSFK